MSSQSTQNKRCGDVRTSGPSSGIGKAADPEAIAATPLACILDSADLILDRDGRPSLGKSQRGRTAVLTNQG